MANVSAALRRLGAELRRLRETAGRTQADVASAIGRTHASLVNWEGGKTKISKADLAYLLAELRAPLDVRKGLEQLREEAGKGAGQWAAYRLPAWLRPIVSFEEDAAEVWTFEPVLIPGLLQTEAYARAVHLAASHVITPADIDRWVAARLHRQRRLSGDKPLKLHAIVAEAALRLQVATPTEMAQQMQALLDVGTRDHVIIQVLPARAGARAAGIASNFAVLHFTEPAIDPPLAYFDGPLGGHIIDDEGDVASLAALFTDLADQSLPADEAAQLITAIMSETTTKGNGHG